MTVAMLVNLRKLVRRGTLAGVRPGRGREMTGAGADSLVCEDSDRDEDVGDGSSFAGIPWMFIAMAGVTAGDETPAKARTGVAGFRGRRRNQTGSSGGSSLAVLEMLCSMICEADQQKGDAAKDFEKNTTLLCEWADRGIQTRWQTGYGHDFATTPEWRLLVCVFVANSQTRASRKRKALDSRDSRGLQSTVKRTMTNE